MAHSPNTTTADVAPASDADESSDRWGVLRSFVARSRRVVRHPVFRAALLVALVVLDLVVPLAYARQAQRIVPTFHLDGSFQTASGLFRLSDGQWPGKDFFPYLGIGPVLTLFPVYALRGSNLAATVFSSRFMTLVCLQLIFAVLAMLAFRRRSAWLAAWAAAIPMLVIEGANAWNQLSTVDSTCGGCLGLVAVAGDPGNSLRPIRAFAPYLLAGIAYLILRSQRGRRTQALVVGAAAGVVAALWSNDYALVSGGLLLLAVSFHWLRTPGERRLRSLVLMWGAAALGFLVSGFAATAGHFVQYLQYNFVDVRDDQFWYFWPWDESTRVYSLGDLLRIMSGERAILALVLVIVVFLYAVVRRDLGWLLIAYVGGVLLMGGVIGTVGGHAGNYFWAFVLWGYIVVGIAMARVVTVAFLRAVRTDPSPSAGRWWETGLRAGLAVLVVVSLVVVDRSAVRNERASGAQLASDSSQVYVPQLGGYIDKAFLPQLRAVRGQTQGVVEEYMGLAGAIDGPRRDLPVDSVIAALGSQRKVFAAEMARHPDMVVTSAPSMSDWVTWNLSANWWFYRTLFKSYAPVQTSPTTLLWRPATPTTWSSVPCTISGSTVELTVPAAGIYELTLNYRGPGTGARAFTMVQNNINLEDPRTMVALDPGARTQQLPVAVQNPSGGRIVLHTVNVPGNRGRLTDFTSCSALRVTPPAGAQTMRLYSRLFPTPEGYTDSTWKNGVSRSRAEFFVVDSGTNDAAFKAAREVKFADGEVRRIQRLEPSGPYLNVYVDGPPLDPDKVGYPHRYGLID